MRALALAISAAPPRAYNEQNAASGKGKSGDFQVEANAVEGRVMPEQKNG
jgi:hypothetical protein